MRRVGAFRHAGWHGWTDRLALETHHSVSLRSAPCCQTAARAHSEAGDGVGLISTESLNVVFIMILCFSASVWFCCALWQCWRLVPARAVALFLDSMRQNSSFFSPPIHSLCYEMGLKAGGGFQAFLRCFAVPLICSLLTYLKSSCLPWRGALLTVLV